jgi:hypothetical protein
MIKGNWIPFDKRAIYFLPKDRPFTVIEAMLSYSVDRDNEHKNSINGYASLWGWSRDKVRRFIQTIETGNDYFPTSKKTGNHTRQKQAIRYVINKLESTKNSDADSVTDRQDDTTIYPCNPLSLNPKKYKDKGIFPKDKKFSPISFENFIKEKIQKNPEEDIDIKKIKTIAYFLDTFQAKQGDQHPYLRPEQWEDAIDNIFNVEGDTTAIDAESCKAIIEKYFSKKYKDGCDYHLPHFLSSGIKRNLFYEELY